MASASAPAIERVHARTTSKFAPVAWTSSAREGPAGSIRRWEWHFVFVELDQRGTGKSYAAIDPVSALTLDQAVTDVIEVSEYLRDRFSELKIYLLGESWGTILGDLAVQRRPDLYPQLYGVDLRPRVPRLEVPVYVLDGAAEFEGRRSLALGWFASLEAPTKQLISYENAAHAVAFEQGDAVQKLLTDTIVPATYAR